MNSKTVLTTFPYGSVFDPVCVKFLRAIRGDQKPALLNCVSSTDARGQRLIPSRAGIEVKEVDQAVSRRP